MTEDYKPSAGGHPITPPPELVEDWIELAKPLPGRAPSPGELATLAARWGADHELEACCKWLGLQPAIEGLRAARRPKPPSLKERALKALETEGNDLSVTAASVIRRALEQLPDAL